ncbi:hypothetical protein [Endothiovibrio diazotrophicus]
MHRRLPLVLATALAFPAVHARELDLTGGSSAIAGRNAVKLIDLGYGDARYTATLYLAMDGTWSLSDGGSASALDLTTGTSVVTGSDTVRLDGLTYEGTAFDATIGLTVDGTWSVQSATAAATDRGPSVTRGGATTVTDNLLAGCPGSRVSGVGTITADDGTPFTVPADTRFTTAPSASDLYNDCTNVRPAGLAEVDLDQVPILEIDPDGEVVTGYLFADNYFELYVNGTLVAVDPVPYTPFNSNVVRFRVKAPYTYAVKLVDWEENLGLGSEENAGSSYHAGDGGFIAVFSDGTVTDATWKAQSYYIAPLESASEVTTLSDGTRSSSAASDSPNCGASCYGVHYTLPSAWAAASFDDSGWPAAVTYTNQTVGVDNKPAFTHFADTFSAAQFIWSSNLVLDNLVLARKSVQ